MGLRSLQILGYRSFSPQSAPVVPLGSALNVFVGPNGSGKTSLMNGLRMLFARPCENSQVHSRENADADYHRGCDTWEVRATVSFPAARVGDDIFPAVEGAFAAKRIRGSQTSWSIGEAALSNGWTKKKPFSLLHDRGFPSGWPRQIVHLEQRAFEHRPEFNSELLLPKWPLLQRDTREFMGFELREPDKMVRPGTLRCSACTQDIQGKLRLGDGLVDANDKALLEGSDGLGHFVFLAMEVRKFDVPAVFILDEPDVFMHPSLQKTLVDYMLHVAGECGHQFFISTHSPYVASCAARAAVGDPARVAIHRVRYDLASHVTPVLDQGNRGVWTVFLELGHRPADVMQPNGVIWVEGPSDVIYLRTWLDMYADKRISWGRDCDIFAFGGNVSNCGFDRDLFWRDLEMGGTRPIADLARLARQSLLLMDRDAEKRGHGKRKTKARVLREWRGAGQRAFLTGHGTETIEDYIEPVLRAECGIPARVRGAKFDKVKAALDYAGKCHGRKLVEVTENHEELGALLSSIYKRIRGWR